MIGTDRDDVTCKLDGERAQGCLEPPGVPPERTHPASGGRVRDRRRKGRRAEAAGGGTDRLDDSADDLGGVEALQHAERREQGMGPLARRAQAPRDEDLHAGLGLPDEAPVARSPSHRRGALGAHGYLDLHIATRGRIELDRHRHRHRQWQYDGHGDTPT